MSEVAAAASAAAPANTSGQTDASNNQVTETKPTEGSNAESAKEGTAVPTPAKVEKKPEPRRLKLKVDGREEELSEEDVIRLAQLGRASDKRFQEAAKSRKQAEEFIRQLKESPWEVLSNPLIGHDARKLAEEYLLKQYEMEQLTPEQKKIKEQEEKLKQYEDEKRQEKKRQEEEHTARLEAHYATDYETKFKTALETANLPKSPKTIKRMAEYMSNALKNGITDIEPAHVVELVRQDYLREISDLFSQTDGEMLLKLLGEPVANKIRKADLARLKKIAPAITAPAPAPEPRVNQPKPEEKKYMSTHEWREALEKREK